jgi:hypothetical protein
LIVGVEFFSPERPCPHVRQSAVVEVERLWYEHPSSAATIVSFSCVNPEIRCAAELTAAAMNQRAPSVVGGVDSSGVQRVREGIEIDIAALDENDSLSCVDELPRKCLSGRPRPNDAKISATLIVAGKLPRVRDHLCLSKDSGAASAADLIHSKYKTGCDIPVSCPS